MLYPSGVLPALDQPPVPVLLENGEGGPRLQHGQRSRKGVGLRLRRLGDGLLSRGVDDFAVRGGGAAGVLRSGGVGSRVLGGQGRFFPLRLRGRRRRSLRPLRGGLAGPFRCVRGGHRGVGGRLGGGGGLRCLRGWFCGSPCRLRSGFCGSICRLGSGFRRSLRWLLSRFRGSFRCLRGCLRLNGLLRRDLLPKGEGHRGVARGPLDGQLQPALGDGGEVDVQLVIGVPHQAGFLLRDVRGRADGGRLRHRPDRHRDGLNGRGAGDAGRLGTWTAGGQAEDQQSGQNREDKLCSSHGWDPPFLTVGRYTTS